MNKILSNLFTVIITAFFAVIIIVSYLNIRYIPSMNGDIVNVEKIKDCGLVQIQIKNQDEFKNFTVPLDNEYLLNKLYDATELEKPIFIRTNSNIGYCEYMYGYQIKDVLIKDSYESLIYNELLKAFKEDMEKENG